MAGTIALQNTRSRGLDTLGRLLVDYARPVVDARISASQRPFEDAAAMQPNLNSRRWAWTHYGFLAPDLPAPYRYLSTAAFIGTTGAIVFDNDHLAADDARNNTTVLSSTASIPHYHYRAYDAPTDCRFADDGSSLQWGDHLTVTAEHPTYRMKSAYGAFGVDLEFTATEHVSYFVKTPLYQHFSLLAPYRGTLRNGARQIDVSGIGTIEYARGASPQSASRRPLPAQLRMPMDFFTHQVVPLPDGTQVLLSDVRAAGASAYRLAHVRHPERPAEVFEDVTFDVLEYGTPLEEPNGDRMPFPRVLRWDIRDGEHTVGSIVGHVDSRPRYGFGNGFVAAYSYSGTWRGESVEGSAYLEWVDCERI